MNVDHDPPGSGGAAQYGLSHGERPLPVSEIILPVTVEKIGSLNDPRFPSYNNPEISHMVHWVVHVIPIILTRCTAMGVKYICGALQVNYKPLARADR